MAVEGRGQENIDWTVMGKSGIADTAQPRQLDFFATCGRRLSCVRVAQGPVVDGSGALIAAGTHSDPANSVSVWSAHVAGVIPLPTPRYI